MGAKGDMGLYGFPGTKGVKGDAGYCQQELVTAPPERGMVIITGLFIISIHNVQQHIVTRAPERGIGDHRWIIDCKSAALFSQDY